MRVVFDESGFYPCVGVFVGGTVPALLGLLEFSDWKLVQALVKACHLVSSQASLRHLQLVPVPDTRSYRSRDTWPLPLGVIAQSIMSPVPLLHFYDTWIYSCFLAPW